MKKDRFANRYMIKVVSSVIIVIINAFIQFLLPWVLDVKDYGYYTYNLNVFTSVVALSNLSVTSAMVSKFSKNNADKGYVTTYYLFWGITALVLNVVLIVLYGNGFLIASFDGQTLLVVMLAFESVAATRFLSDNIGIFDAMAISRYPAVMQIILKMCLCFVLLIGYMLGRFSLVFFYISQIFITMTISIVMIFAFYKEHGKSYGSEDKYTPSRYVKEYYSFCKPLVMSAVFSHGITIFINWALLKWGGAVEQAMFGIAWQMNTVICMIFSPFADLSKREFAVIHNDDELLSKRFIQSSKIIIWMTSYFAIFVGVLSKWIVLLCFGEKYKEAYLVTLLIMLYTVHQSWGQMGLCFLHATEKTRICAILAFGSQLITLLCVFAFQIPNGLFEKGLGAIGIALTYIIPNLISVNVMYLYICKTKNISFLKLEFNSLISIALCSSLAMIMYNVFGRLNVGEGRIGYFVKIFGSGIVYTIVICICVLKYPHLLGLDRGVILGYFGKILKRKEL